MIARTLEDVAMTSRAHRLLERVAAAGGSVALDGDNLELSAPAPLPDELISELRAAKPDLLDHLRGGAWDSTDWCALYGERAAIMEHDGGLPREEAERRAHEETVLHWLHRHPPEPTNPEHCAHCNQPTGEAGNGAVPFLAGERGHCWLHHRCWEPWTQARREEALAALEILKEKI